MVKGQIIFGGISSLYYDAIITGDTSQSAPERDCQTVEIPGRNGDIVIDNGRYKNSKIKNTLFFYRRKSYEAYRQKMMGLIGYQRLESTFFPDEYRMARISGGLEADMKGIHNNRVEVYVTFDCKPQRYLKSGEFQQEFTETTKDALFNPTGQPALPLIRVYGAGTVGVGSSTVTISEHGQDYMDIDCELQDCFCGTENLNGYATFSAGFPVLQEGLTGISIDGVTKVEIIPRWWRL